MCVVCDESVVINEGEDCIFKFFCNFKVREMNFYL